MEELKLAIFSHQWGNMFEFKELNRCIFIQKVEV